jgi:hypothetical protein
MNLELNNATEITLIVKLPHEIEKYRSIKFELGEEIVKCFLPLPRNREIPWDVKSDVIAREIMMKRNVYAQIISDILRKEIIKMMQYEDTVNGQ